MAAGPEATATGIEPCVDKVGLGVAGAGTVVLVVIGITTPFCPPADELASAVVLVVGGHK